LAKIVADGRALFSVPTKGQGSLSPDILLPSAVDKETENKNPCHLAAQFLGVKLSFAPCFSELLLSQAFDAPGQLPADDACPFIL